MCVGEDIELSDGEEEEEGEEAGPASNELVYDDFYRPDSDYGSDVEDDGMVDRIKKAAVKSRSIGDVEKIGPLFIQKNADGDIFYTRSFREPYVPLPAGSSDDVAEVNKLLKYSVVCYAETAGHAPVFGQPFVTPPSSSARKQAEKKAAEKAEIDAAVSPVPSPRLCPVSVMRCRCPRYCR